MRFLFHIKYRWSGKDTYAHYLIIKNIKKNNDFSGSLFQIDNYPSKTFRYPILLHSFLSLVLINNRNYKFRFAPSLFDIFNFFIIIFFFYDIVNLNKIILIGYIYFSIPLLSLMVLTFSPRSFSNLFFSIAMLSTKLLLIDNLLIIFYILGILSLVIIFLSHRLTLQTIVIVYIVLGIIFANYHLLLIILFGYVVTLLITKGEYQGILKDHLRNLKRHFTYGDLKKKKRIERPERIIGSIPYIVLIPIIVILNFNKLNINFILNFYWIWLLVIFILCICWIWGDAYRYLTFGIIPIIYCMINYFFSKPLYLLMILICFIISNIIVILLIFRHYKNKTISKEKLFFINKMKDLFNKKNEIIVLPTSETLLLKNFLKGKFRYPYPSKIIYNLIEIPNEILISVDYIIYNKQKIKIFKKDNNIVYKNKYYAVFKNKR